MTTLTQNLRTHLEEQVSAAQRPDLFRAPLCTFSAANDPRYQSLKSIIGPWHATPTELLPGARSVISYFVPFTRQAVSLTKIETPTAQTWADAYIIINRLFGQIGQGMVAILEGEGYPSLNIASTHNFDAKTLRAAWSHRSAAVISGLGSLGVNRMLITEKGSAGRLCSVITTAPLPPAPSSAAPQCLYMQTGGCLLCVKHCPTGALDTNSLDGATCYKRCLENADYFGKPDGDVCGKCVVACPPCYLD